MNTPHPDNACAAAYTDWLEVHLLPDCNAKCKWCVENDGFCPSEAAPWGDLVDAICDHPAANVILLGGEPTLHPNLKGIISALDYAGKKVWMTTNGSLLTDDFVRANLYGLHGINISMHDPIRNSQITGVRIRNTVLKNAISVLKQQNTHVRFNCNCIASYIDSYQMMEQYVGWAKSMGADKVRFAELKNDDGTFVDLIKILEKFHIPEDPYKEGCSTNIIMHGMHVNIRTMCGFQTPHRSKPECPAQTGKQVMYRDAKLYDGWQKVEGRVIKRPEMEKLFDLVAQGKVTPADATEQIVRMKTRLVNTGGQHGA